MYPTRVTSCPTSPSTPPSAAPSPSTTLSPPPAAAAAAAEALGLASLTIEAVALRDTDAEAESVPFSDAVEVALRESERDVDGVIVEEEDELVLEEELVLDVMEVLELEGVDSGVQVVVGSGSGSCLPSSHSHESWKTPWSSVAKRRKSCRQNGPQAYLRQGRGRGRRMHMLGTRPRPARRCCQLLPILSVPDGNAVGGDR